MGIYSNGFASFSSFSVAHFGNNASLKKEPLNIVKSKASLMTTYMLAHPDEFAGKQLTRKELASFFMDNWEAISPAPKQNWRGSTMPPTTADIGHWLDLFIDGKFFIDRLETTDKKMTKNYYFKPITGFNSDIKRYKKTQKTAELKKEKAKLKAEKMAKPKKPTDGVKPSDLAWNEKHPLGLTPDEAVLAETFASGPILRELKNKPPAGWNQEKVSQTNRQLLYKFAYSKNGGLTLFLIRFYKILAVALKEGATDEQKESSLKTLASQLASKAESPFGQQLLKQRTAFKVTRNAAKEDPLLLPTRYLEAAITRITTSRPSTSSLDVVG